mmetsp:Transcript_88201/g.248220  ORF Transcript_88201/g.248220 Transcript_88201/m.248220 type:complete len:223 (-) Transcript_88201:290-958(-)
MQERRADVVAIAVKTPGIILVDIYGGANKVRTKVSREVVPEPAVQRLAELRVAFRLLLRDDVPSPVGDETEGVAVDEGLPLPHDVQTRYILPEVPKAKKLQYLKVRHLTALCVQRLKHFLGLLICHNAPRAHQRRFPVSGGVRENVTILDVQGRGALDFAEALEVRPLPLDALHQIHHLRLVEFLTGRVAEVRVSGQDFVSVGELLEVFHCEKVERHLAQRF